MRQVLILMLLAFVSLPSFGQKPRISGIYENCKYGYVVTLPDGAEAYAEGDSGVVMALPPRPMSEKWPMPSPNITITASRDLKAYQQWLKDAQRDVDLVPVNDPMSSVKVASVRTFLDELPVMSSPWSIGSLEAGTGKLPPLYSDSMSEWTYGALREDSGIVYSIRVSEEYSRKGEHVATLRAVMSSFRLRPVGCSADSSTHGTTAEKSP